MQGLSPATREFSEQKDPTGNWSSLNMRGLCHDLNHFAKLRTFEIQ